MLQFNSSEQLGTTQTLAHFPPRGMEGKRFRRAKVRKFMGWHEGNFLIKRKIKQKKRTKECKLQLLTTTVSSSAMAALANSQPSSTTWCNCLVTWYYLSWFCSFPASWAHPASLLTAQYEKWKRPWLCTSSARQQLKHLCATHTVVIMKPKHSTTWAIIYNINPILTKASTAWNVTLGWVHRYLRGSFHNTTYYTVAYTEDKHWPELIQVPSILRKILPPDLFSSIHKFWRGSLSLHFLMVYCFFLTR